MNLRARLARIESTTVGHTSSLGKRRIHCTVRLPDEQAQADLEAAFVSAGLRQEDGDLIRLIVCEWPGQRHPIESEFQPTAVVVR
jgi:hypothetical protein